MRRLHVLHVIGGGDTGGAMSHLLPLLTSLREQGCDVHLLCLGEGGLAEEAAACGFPVRTLPMRNPWDVSVLGSLRRDIAGGPPTSAAAAPGAWTAADSRGGISSYAGVTPWDVVHTHGMRANLPVRLVLPTLVGRLGRRPCLFTTVHSDVLLDYGSPALARTYQLFDRATLPLVDSIICVSDSLRSLLLQRGYPIKKTVRIWSGLELQIYEAAGSPAKDETLGGTTLQALAPTGSRPPRIGTVARLARVKDLELLLETVTELRRTVPEIECIVVGDGPELERLQSVSRRLGVDDAVHFAGRTDDVEAVLRGLDVYMVTSVFEGGVSMSVLEAMAAGLPVVTTAAGGVAEAVKDGETGFVVSRDQERGALAAALAQRAAVLLSDDALRARMGAAGARRVRESFSAHRTAAQTLRAYERCLAARGEAL